MDRRVIRVRSIGVVHSPFQRKVDAPRQPRAAEDVEGRIELEPALLHALEDLAGFEHIWVLTYFDRAEGFRPKVLPPRSRKKRGVFATRAPHRPNPIGLSLVRLVRIEGTTLHVRGLDMLDGTPVLDIKPYVPWCDSIPQSRTGWLEEEASTDERPQDPLPAYEVTLEARAAGQLAWLAARGEELEPTLRAVLSASPHPHPYRRIRRAQGGFVLALSEWRIVFRLEDRVVRISEIRSGYRSTQLDAHPLHRAFVDEAS